MGEKNPGGCSCEGARVKLIQFGLGVVAPLLTTLIPTNSIWRAYTIRIALQQFGLTPGKPLQKTHLIITNSRYFQPLPTPRRKCCLLIAISCKGGLAKKALVGLKITLLKRFDGMKEMNFQGKQET